MILDTLSANQSGPWNININNNIENQHLTTLFPVYRHLHAICVKADFLCHICSVNQFSWPIRHPRRINCPNISCGCQVLPPLYHLFYSFHQLKKHSYALLSSAFLLHLSHSSVSSFPMCMSVRLHPARLQENRSVGESLMESLSGSTRLKQHN